MILLNNALSKIDKKNQFNSIKKDHESFKRLREFAPNGMVTYSRQFTLDHKCQLPGGARGYVEGS